MSLAPTLPLALGSLVGFGTATLDAGVGAVAVLSALVLAYHPRRAVPRAGKLFVLGWCLGGLLLATPNSTEGSPFVEDPSVVTVEVELASWPVDRTYAVDAKARLLVYRRGGPWRHGGGRVLRLQLPSDIAAQTELRPGSRLRLRGVTSWPATTANGLLSEDRGTAVGQLGRPLPVIRVKSSRLVEVLNSQQCCATPASGWIDDFRQRFVRSAADAERQHDVGARVSAALWLGRLEMLPPPIADAVRHSGLSHYFAASGLHVALVVAGVALALRWVLGQGTGPRRLVCAALSVGAAWFYALAVGGGPAVTRAAWILTGWSVARLFDRRVPGLQLLALALVATLSGHSADVSHLGFALSFSAALGIWLFLGPLSSWFPARSQIAPLSVVAARSSGGVSLLARLPAILGRRSLDALLVTLGAQWATLPFVSAIFGRWSVLSVLGNLLAGPLVVFLMPLALLRVHLHGLAPTPLMTALSHVESALASLLLEVSRLAAVGTVPVDPAPLLWWPSSLAAILVLRWIVEWRRLAAGPLPIVRPPPTRNRVALRVLGTGGVLALVIYALGWVPAQWLAVRPDASANLRHPGHRVDSSVHFIDVAQGDATLFVRGNRGVLVDGGGWERGAVAQRVLEPVLAKAGVERLDAIVLTHGDADHCLGLLGLVQGRWGRLVRELWLSESSRGLSKSDPAGCLPALAEAMAGRVRYLPAGITTSAAGWRVHVLGAPRGSHSTSAPLEGNAASMALSLQRKGRCVLITGDLDRAGERRLVSWASRQGLDLSCSVLQVGHHGSQTSSDPAFLAAIRPQWAVVSSGLRNRYGHPHPDVVERLCTGGSMVLRTDLDGRVEMRFLASGSWRLRTARSRSEEASWSVCSPGG